MRLPTIQAVDALALALATKADFVVPLVSIFGPKFAVWGRNKSSAKSYAKVERTVNPRREPA